MIVAYGLANDAKVKHSHDYNYNIKFFVYYVIVFYMLEEALI